ncbi:MAG: Fic family protein [Bacteroidota bacterium]
MKPPFSITPEILDTISRIERLIGRIESLDQPKTQPHLRKSNRVRTVQGSLAIEGNTLNLDQVTALIEGKTVVGKKEEIREVLNAIEIYDQISTYDPLSMKQLKTAHQVMMDGLIKTAGQWRSSNVGIMKGSEVSHVAPQAKRVEALMMDLFSFLKESKDHLLIKGCIFHYELEFIHPFEDGNGRMGRFWHSLLLYQYHPTFEFIPVESLIKEHQQDYYDALEKSDQLGESTPFVTFSLSVILKALEDFIDVLRPVPLTAEERLQKAAEHFVRTYFSRKDYLDYFKTISSATASRDLKQGVSNNLLCRKGDKAQTKYQFK